MFSLRLGSGPFNWLPRGQQQRGPRRSRAAADSTATAGETVGQRIGGFGGIAKAGLVAGTVLGGGNVGLQWYRHKELEDAGKKVPDYDFQQSLRLAGFGALLFGPYTHILFSALNGAMPALTAGNLFAKLAFSEVALAPAVLALVYCWNLVGEGAKPTVYADGVGRELTPTTIDGWKLWLPALAVNFLAIPGSLQVLFASAAGAAFTAYKSPASSPIWAPRKISLPTTSSASPAVPAKKRWYKRKSLTLVLLAAWFLACLVLKKDSGGDS